MPTASFSKRSAFAVEILHKLKQVCSELDRFNSEMDDYSKNSYEKIFAQKKYDIQKKIDCFWNNVKRVEELNNKITSLINEWFEFSKNKKNMASPFYPIRFRINKNNIKRNIKKTNEEILDISVENRFIKENLNDWEHDLKKDSVGDIKSGKFFKKYESLISEKNNLLNELMSFLPTIEGLSPIEIDLSNIDEAINKINSLN
mgnify:CR=1 FL=1